MVPPANYDRRNIHNSMSMFNCLLEHTIIYISWQSPFASGKLELRESDRSGKQWPE
jgi:hypothetical protein